jgi:hypothetical protein
MKKLVTILIIAISTIIIMSMQSSNQCKNLVPDEATAIKIAEAIWLPIYGEKIYDKKPFVAKLVDGKIWEVSGTLNTQKGGVPYIEIQKEDCKILKVIHTK